MRLLFVCPSLTGGGAERQWSILLPRLAERGFDVRLLTLDGEGPFFAPLVETGVPAYCAGMRSRGDAAGLGRALRYALAIRADAVVTRSVSGQLVGHAVARSLGVPHVTTEHRPCDAALAFLPYDLYRRALTRSVAPFIDHVLAVTEAQRAACAWYGYRPERVRVIENGVQPPALTAPRSETRDQLGLPADAFVAVHVAALRREKHVSDFVLGVQRAHAADPRIHGLVVGDGLRRGEVEAAIARAPGVRLLGFRSDVPTIMAASDVVCLASSHEALPMVLIEAMALGRPVVATRVGGVPDVVLDGATGMLVAVDQPGEIAARLRELASNPALAERLGAAGRARQRARYTADLMVDRHVEFFRALHGRHGRARSAA